jgi:hypothetical protein
MPRVEEQPCVHELTRPQQMLLVGKLGDVFEVRATYERVGRIKTVGGARTSLLVSELDVFLLAVRATITEDAAIWVYKPQP